MFQEFPSYQEWLESAFWPVMGRETVEETEVTEPADGGGSETEETETSAGGAGSETEDGSESETEENDADEDELDRVRGERDKLRSQLAAAEAAAQKAKSDARKAREDAAKKGGNWEQVAKEREAELSEANERATESEKRALIAEEKLDRFQREVRITRIATKLSFRDPSDVISALQDQTELTGDDKSCERAVRKLAELKPYLIDQRRARGRAMENGGGDGSLTKEQLSGMSADEINANWDSVSSSLVRSPTRR